MRELVAFAMHSRPPKLSISNFPCEIACASGFPVCFRVFLDWKNEQRGERKYFEVILNRENSFVIRQLLKGVINHERGMQLSVPVIPPKKHGTDPVFRLW